MKTQANRISVFVAGQVLKKLLTNFPDKVRGQEAVANRKANALYAALDAHPDAYKVVPDKNVRSRMNICFRVTKVLAVIRVRICANSVGRQCRRSRKDIPERCIGEGVARSERTQECRWYVR